MVATGRAELMVDPVVALWDLARDLPIMEEAGGAFTDWQGRRTIRSGPGDGHQRPAAGRSAGDRARINVAGDGRSRVTACTVAVAKG